MKVDIPFERYPYGGQKQLGPCKRTDCCRSASGARGYGEEVMHISGVRDCIYCGEDLTQSLVHWLTFQRDHVVPHSEYRRLAIPSEFYDDIANMGCACAACNAYDCRYTAVWAEPKTDWTWDEFLVLRDRIYSERKARISQRLDAVRARHAAGLWRPDLSDTDSD